MIEQFFKRPAAIEQHRSAAVVGPYLDGVVADLAELGYTRSTVRRYVYACEDFGRFLTEQRVRLGEVDATHVETFLRETADQRTWRGVAVNAVSAVRGRRGPIDFLLARLREKGVIAAEARQAGGDAPHHDVLAGYLAFLRQHRGLQERTIGQLHIGRFLRHIEGGDQAIRTLVASQFDGFLVECGRRMSRRSIGRVSAALRSFLRYLHLSGQVDRDLSLQVAAPRVYALESVPRALPWEDVLKVLAAPDRSTAAGRRDYAVLQLLAVYGLRAGEVAALALADIDWRGERIRIRRSKGGDASWYPLHSEVGEAIADYLRQGRPASPHSQVFLALSAPVRPFPRSGPVSNIVARHLRRAGVEAPHWGAHTLRHSRAVHLLQHGFSLKAIGDLFGHRHPQSTFVYAKAAIDDLRSVGLEITEVLP
jgi:site-specific recombinase XerD